jgi:hypothetical protein
MARSQAFQVNLDPHQHRQLKLLSERRGASMGSLVRESVAQYLAGTPVEEDPLLLIIGKFEDPGEKPYGDVGEEHDRYLADIIAAESDAAKRTRTRPRTA